MSTMMHEERGPYCKHCSQPVHAWSVSMDGNHSWAHVHGGWYCVINGTRPGTKAEPVWPGGTDAQ
jgi:hypothetical protein